MACNDRRSNLGKHVLRCKECRISGRRSSTPYLVSICPKKNHLNIMARRALRLKEGHRGSQNEGRLAYEEIEAGTSGRDTGCPICAIFHGSTTYGGTYNPKASHWLSD
ncbi:unnamed protein product [Ilex paraguariensis]|uniref:Uncharacterized protein n=1 Tax=Ilex paraguariensis TaxID=185542 RepID=A0ABC8UHY3_9AQUA